LAAKNAEEEEERKANQSALLENIEKKGKNSVSILSERTRDLAQSSIFWKFLNCS
jgi:hypothetical protein